MYKSINMQLTNFEIQSLLQGEILIILGENTSIRLKYILTKLSNLLSVHLDVFTKIKEDIIRKYGVADEFGRVEIKVSTPEYDSVINEITPIGNDKIEFEFEKIPISLFEGIKSNNNFPILFTLLDEKK